MKRLTIVVVFMLGIILSVWAQETDSKAGKTITISTTMGDIRVLLYDETPLHQANMLKLIKEGYYDDQMFHRVIENFMVQGGDPHSKGAERGQRLGTGGPGYTIEAEISETLYHKKGALAAARQGDGVNPEQRSSGSQFYLVRGQVFTVEQLNSMIKSGRCNPLNTKQVEIYTSIGGTPHLDGAYTVFGEVIEGLEFVDQITWEPTDSYNRPLQNITYKITIDR
jgi:cyclophilin family peptidyl-prolyl cis-trans isomerase